jgi:hypothetical protein
MPPIYVDTDHGPKNKLYDASMAGQAATKAESKMQEKVKAAIEADAGFTTTKDKNSKGYVILLKISKLETAGGETKCTLAGEIVKYPKTFTKSHGKKPEMVSLGWGGSAAATGKPDYAIVQCVEAVVESMMKKGMPAMTSDMARR